ncbi:MAG: hypothetical protein AAF503_03075, partial [Pseudomonadota bacterium]
MTLLVALILAAACLAASNKGNWHGERAEFARAYFWPLSRVWRRVAVLVAILPMIFALAGWFLGYWHADPRILGPVLAATVPAVAVAVLAQDLRFAIIGLFAVWGGLTLSLGPMMSVVPVIGMDLTTVAPIAAVGFWLFCFVTLVIFAPTKCRNPYDMSFLAGITAVLSVYFWIAANADLGSDWAIPVGGAVTSMAVWLVKEFGSDLPNIYAELIDTQIARSRSNSRNDKGTGVEQSYLDAGNWDLRTDLSFDFAGAFLGAGVLSGGSLLSSATGAWAVGAELIGVLIFLLVFIGGGRNWAYRQNALDRSGVGRGNMLAVLDFAVDLYPAGGTAGHAIDEPREKLMEFAQGSAQFRHLIVVGGRRFNDRLADAIVSEAVLGDLPPEMFAHLEEEASWRRARKLTFGLTESGHMSTARDMTTLGRHLLYDYPQYYNLFSR